MKRIRHLCTGTVPLCSTVLARTRALCRQESGDALVEMALVVSLILFPMLVGSVELGTLVNQSIEVSNAAHAGAVYGTMGSSYAANSTGITAAAQAEAPDFNTSLSVNTSTFYACSKALSGTQYSTQSAATAACTGTTNHSLELVQVATSATVTPPIRCPGLPSSFTLRGYSVMEVTE